MNEKVFRHYDQTALDAQLNLRARWPEHERYLTFWAEESAKSRDSCDGHYDLAYGSAPGERLDLFPVPGATAPTPLVAFIHGGYWQGLDKDDFSYLAPGFLDRGIAFASINYDLAPNVRVREIVAQVRRALAWLIREAESYGYEPDRILVAGHSAGGHLAAMALAAVDHEEDGEKGHTMRPIAVCAVSGVYDLEPLHRSYHQPVLKLDAAEVAAYSPIHRLPAQATRLILALGSEETEEFHRQQATYVALCRSAGHEVTIVDLPGRNHFTAIDALAECDSPLFEAVCRLAQGANE